MRKSELGLLAGCGRGLAAAALLALALVAPHHAAGHDDGEDDPETSRRDAAGHRKMLDELAKLTSSLRQEEDYFGERDLVEFRARLEASAEAPPLERIQLHFAVGELELRAGNSEQAIAELTAAYELFESFEPGDYPRLRTRVTYHLAVAHMRLGETANCVAHHTSKSCILPIGEEGVHVDPAGSRAAIRYFTEVLAREEAESPAGLSSRWLLNIAYMTLGEYPDGVPEAYRIAPEVFEAGAEFPRFVDVAPELGLNTFDLCGGALVEDFDNDGLLDILSSTWDSRQSLRLHLADGKGGFDDVTDEAGLEGITGGLNLVPADYNGDGRVDVLVLRGAWLEGPAGNQPNSLLRNEGDGTFTDVTFNAGLGDAFYPTQAAAWADYDGDGDLDLYVGNEATQKARNPSQLFRNDGDGTFTDVAGRAGVANLRFAKGVAWGDYDGDRRPDLFVSNMGGWNRLYHNEGDGTFTDVATEADVRGPFDSFATWFWDFDNDGNLDLYVASYYQGLSGGFRPFPVVADALGLPHQAERNCLYRGDGRGGFTEVGEERGLSRLTFAMGANFGDLDNDGYLDFYLGTGYPGYDGLMPNVMFHNERGERFGDVTAAGGFGHVQKGHGIAFADLDGDGDQDVFEQMGGAYPGDGFGNVLYENPGFGNHWVKLRLEGVRSNKLGVGAVIRVDVTEGGKRRTIYHHVTSGGSFGGNPFEPHIGLGRAERIERLEVYWPTSDTRQSFENVEVDQRYLVREGERRLESAPETPRPFARE